MSTATAGVVRPIDSAGRVDRHSRARPTRVLHMSPFAHWGGAITAMLTLVAEQARRGPVFVVTLLNGYQAQAIRDAGATAITVFDKGDDFVMPQAARLVRTYGTLVRAVEEHGIELIHVHSAAGVKFCLPVARLTGRPLVSHQRDNYRRDRFHAGLRYVDHVIAVSEWIKRNLPEPLRAKTTAIHDAVEVPAIAARPENAVLRVGTAGRCMEDKGQDLLISAALQVAQRRPELAFEVHLWGWEATPYGEALRRSAATAPPGANVRFFFEPFRRDMENFYNLIDVAVVPSRYPDPFPRTVTEAMAHWKPTLVAGHGGMIEIVEHGQTGLAFAPKDADDLSVQLERMLSDAALRRRFASAGRAAIVERLGATHYADAVEQVYRGVLAER